MIYITMGADYPLDQDVIYPDTGAPLNPAQCPRLAHGCDTTDKHRNKALEDEVELNLQIDDAGTF